MEAGRCSLLAGRAVVLAAGTDGPTSTTLVDSPMKSNNSGNQFTSQSDKHAAKSPAEKPENTHTYIYIYIYIHVYIYIYIYIYLYQWNRIQPLGHLPIATGTLLDANDFI